MPERAAELSVHPQAGRLGPPGECAMGDHVRDDPPARAHHSSELAQCGVLVGDLAEDRDQIGAVEFVVPERQLEGVGPRGRDVVDSRVSRSPQRVVEHLLLQVDDVPRSSTQSAETPNLAASYSSAWPGPITATCAPQIAGPA